MSSFMISVVGVQHRPAESRSDPGARGLLDEDHAEAEVVDAGPAVLLQHRHREEAVRGRLGEELARHDARALPVGVVRGDLFGEELGEALAVVVVLGLEDPAAPRGGAGVVGALMGGKYTYRTRAI